MSTIKGYYIEFYVAANGRSPFKDWLNDMRDTVARASIQRRLVRIEGGNLGDYKALGNGIFEFRIDMGPGYRAYFTMMGQSIVLLLCGGDKASQSRDIKKAREYFHDYKTQNG